MDKKTEDKNFEEYRRDMHPEAEEGRSVVPAPKRSVGWIFGIFMIIVYVGMGVLLITNFFKWDSDFTWVRLSIGIILIIYGVFRGYRMYAGSEK